MSRRNYLSFVFSLIAFLFFFPLFQTDAYSEETSSHLFKRGIEALQKGDLKRAEADFRAVLKEEPDNPFAYFNLGSIFIATRRIDLAFQALNRAAELKPDLTAAHIRLADLYELQGNLSEAAWEMEEAYLYSDEEESAEGKLVRSRLEDFENKRAARERWDLGMESLRKGNYPAAEEAFRAVLLLQPQNAQAHNFLGIVLGIQTRFDEAIASFKESLRLKPDLTDSRIRLAELYQIKGEWTEARSEIEKALFFLEEKEGAEAQSLEEKLNAVDDQIEIKGLADRANREIENNNIDAAIIALQEVTQLDPKRALTYFNLGNLWAQKNRLDQAESAFKKAVETEPNYAEAYQRLGQVYELEGFWGRAKAQYEKALSTPAGKSPSAREALQALVKRVDQEKKQAKTASQAALEDGQKKLDEGDLDQAISLLTRASALDPENPEIHLRLGILYERKEKFDLAMNEMRGALEFNPNLAEPHQRLASLLEKKGYFYQALKEWKEAESLSPSEENQTRRRAIEEKLAAVDEEMNTLMERAEKDWREGRRAAAIETLQKGLLSAPDHVRARMMLASVLADAGETAKAFSEFSAVLLLSPSSGEAHRRLGRLYAAAGQWKEALREFEAALQSKELSEEGRAEALLDRSRAEMKLSNEREAKRDFNLGNRLMAEQDYVGAAQAFEKVARLYPENVFALYQLGLAYENAGNKEAAERYYQRVLSIQPAYIQARERLGFVFESQGKIEGAIRTYREALSIGGLESTDRTWLEGRLAPLEKRLYVTANQTVLSYNSNPAGSSHPKADLSSTLGASLTYYLRRDARLQIPVALSSQNTFFYRFNTIFSGNTASITAISVRSPYSTSLGYSSTFGIARGGPTGIDQTGLLSLSKRGEVLSTVGLDYSYDDSISFQSKSFDAIRQNIRLSAAKDWDQKNLSASIHFLNNAAKLNDQASRTMGAGFSYTQAFAEKIRGGISYNLDRVQFTNLDSLALSRQETKKRRNFLHSLTLSASYLFQKDLTLGMSYTEVRNYSNLPALDNVTIEELLSGQASSLGNYSQRLVNLNLSWVF